MSDTAAARPAEADAPSGVWVGAAGAGAPGADGAPGTAGATPVTARRPATDAERRALASVVRLRILRLCLYEELTNREIAERLDRNPATVLHHVRTLADQGFLLAGQPRRGRRGSREIPYRATGKSWNLSMGELPAGVESGDPGSADRGATATILLNTFLAEVAAVPPDRLETTRLGLKLSEEHWTEFTERLQTLLDEYARRTPDPDGRRWSIFLAMHPER